MMSFEDKFKILVEGAKYDVSCSSSGSERKGKNGMIGSANAAGICHSFTADGRCISLLKILMSNCCSYDCKYCVNRRSHDVPRATMTPEELCNLVLQFYRRNYIEGLFLSSAVFGTPDETMERLLQTVMLLRIRYRFNGYIHLKAIPAADPRLIAKAAVYVDRMSMNIELPSEQSLRMLAPQKNKEGIVRPMTQLARIYTEQEGDKYRKKVLPAGQTTQMIIGASPDSDSTVLRLAGGLYRKMEMKRVYYSAYVPMGDASVLPVKPPNLVRENRLYQADWLLRFYGFDAEELVAPGENLPLDLDPKSAWAVRHLAEFPVEVNTAPYETLLRVPGIGVKNAWRILQARRYTKLKYEDLRRMRVVLKRASHFLLIDGHYYGHGFYEENLRKYLVSAEGYGAVADQISLLDTTAVLPEAAYSALAGEL